MHVTESEESEEQRLAREFEIWKKAELKRRQERTAKEQAAKKAQIAEEKRKREEKIAKLRALQEERRKKSQELAEMTLTLPGAMRHRRELRDRGWLPHKPRPVETDSTAKTTPTEVCKRKTGSNRNLREPGG